MHVSYINLPVNFRLFQQCRDNINKAFKYVDQLISQRRFKTLEHDFSSCADISQPDNTWFFTNNLGNFLDGTVQYNGQTGGMDIGSVCRYMNTKSKTPYQNLVQLIEVKKEFKS